MIGLLSYLLYTNWRLTLCFIVFYTSDWHPGADIASEKMRKLSIQVQNTMGDVNHVVQETINGNSVDKSFAGEVFEQQRFYKSSEENLRRGLKWWWCKILTTRLSS